MLGAVDQKTSEKQAEKAGSKKIQTLKETYIQIEKAMLTKSRWMRKTTLKMNQLRR